MNFRVQKYLLIYPDCIPVKGYLKSTLCDFTRNKIVSFDSSFFDLFQEFNSKNLVDLYKDFHEDSHENLNTFINFLLENGFGEIVDDINNFKEINIGGWEAYGTIDNAIIDVENLKHDFDKLITQLNFLKCKFLQIRFYSTIYSLDEINTILKMAEDTSIEGIEIILKYDKLYREADYISFFEENFLISALYIFGFSEKKDVSVTYGFNGKITDKFVQSKVFFLDQNLINEAHCGIIDKSYFCVNTISDFSHNKLYNSCLNKKISIDRKGNIKNCPSLSISYGNIRDLNLWDVIDSEFMKIWNIKKDDIDICKICEYRYVCTDCRAFLKKPSNIYSQPLKCGYNPYENKWEDWKATIHESVLTYYGIL